MADRKLIIFLIIYAILSLSVFSFMDVTISNSYQRALAAGFIAEFLKNDLWKIESVNDSLAAFVKGQEQYKIFSGIADWQPMQVILLAFGFLIFGVNKFAFSLIPLLVTLCALFFVYRLAERMYDGKTALLATAITALSTLFFYESAAPMLENGMALFAIMTIYCLSTYLDTQKPRYFLLTAFAFGLGAVHKIQIVLLLPALFITFIIKADLRKFFATKKNHKMLLISALILLLTLTPLIAKEAVLMELGLSTFLSRSVGRIQYVYAESVNKGGFLTAHDFEFQNELPQYKRDLIVHRYNLSYLQKLAAVFSSLFFNWIILPFALLGIFRRKPMKFTSAELMLLLFVLVNMTFFTLHGLIPRLILPAVVPLSIFAARGALKLPKKAIAPATAVILLTLSIQTTMFLAEIHQGRHIQSMQHDYDAAAQYILDNTQGAFTVITTRVYQMAFSFLKLDKEKRAYVELAPETQEEFSNMLNGIFSKPELAKTAALDYPLERPQVRYVVVHENLETGPLRETADYNLLEFMNSYERADEPTIIESGFPNAKIWVYRIS